MTKFIKNILSFTYFTSRDESDDLANFFLRASSAEKKKVFKRVISLSNKDQKRYLETYQKTKKSS